MTTSTVMNPGWRIQLAIHRSVRRDLERLALALGDVEVPTEAARTYWAVASAQLHHHHVFEDTVIWPLMGERLGESVLALLGRNAHEHQVMASAMEKFDTAVATTDAVSAGAALGLLGEAIATHLAHEEADVLPLIPEAFTSDDIAFFQAEDAKTNSPSTFLSWMLDDAPGEDMAFFTDHLPSPVRDQLGSEWAPAWRRKVSALGLQEGLAAR